MTDYFSHISDDPDTEESRWPQRPNITFRRFKIPCITDLLDRICFKLNRQINVNYM